MRFTTATCRCGKQAMFVGLTLDEVIDKIHESGWTGFARMKDKDFEICPECRAKAIGLKKTEEMKP